MGAKFGLMMMACLRDTYSLSTPLTEDDWWLICILPFILSSSDAWYHAANYWQYRGADAHYLWTWRFKWYRHPVSPSPLTQYSSPQKRTPLACTKHSLYGPVARGRSDIDDGRRAVNYGRLEFHGSYAVNHRRWSIFDGQDCRRHRESAKFYASDDKRCRATRLGESIEW